MISNTTGARRLLDSLFVATFSIYFIILTEFIDMNDLAFLLEFECFSFDVDDDVSCRWISILHAFANLN